MLGLAHKITKTPKFSFHQKTSKIQKLKFRFKIDLTRLLMSFSLFQIRSKKRKYKKTNKVVKNVVSQFPLKCLNHPFCDFCPLFITHQQVCKSVRVGLNLNELQKKEKKCYDQSTCKFSDPAKYAYLLFIGMSKDVSQTIQILSDGIKKFTSREAFRD